MEPLISTITPMTAMTAAMIQSTVGDIGEFPPRGAHPDEDRTPRFATNA
jgi:hypothetical protein